MGLFTYRQTKKARKQVEALRVDQARRAQTQDIREAARAAEAREEQLFQQLPPEGKAEFRELVAVYDAHMAQWNALGTLKRARGANQKEHGRMFLEHSRAKEQVFRKYDLIP